MEAPKKKASSSSSPNGWSSLPPELLGIVAERLGHRQHLIPFRAVCKPWRNAVPFPEPASLPDLPFPISGESHGGRGRYRLFPSTLMYMEPPNGDGGWVLRLYLDSLPPGPRIRLRDPLSETVFITLPTKCPSSLFPLDYKFRVISESYSLLPVGTTKPPSPPLFPVKAAVSTNPWAVLTTDHDYNGNKLDVWKLGDVKWTRVEDDGQFMDIVFFKRKFYAVDITKRTISIDPVTLEISQVASPVRAPRTTYMHLLESIGDLYLVEIYDNEDNVYSDFDGNDDSSDEKEGSDEKEESDENDDTDDTGESYHTYERDSTTFKPMIITVRRLDEEDEKWVLTKNLDNRAFLVGDCSSCSVSSVDFPRLKPGAIYFHDRVYIFHKHEDAPEIDYPGCLSCIFDINNGRIDALDKYGFENHDKIFWPPSSWLL